MLSRTLASIMRRRLLSNAGRLLCAIVLGVAFVSEAFGFGPLKKGYIQNDNGEKCWYTQKTDPDSTYFHGDLKSDVGIITFTDPQCMSGKELGLDVNKMTINNVISRWYSHKDAAFQTRVAEMYKGSPMQKKGQCIQSQTYPIIGITIDYFIENNSITGVIHGPSVAGCTN